MIVVDTGVAFGAADRDDPDHAGSAAVLRDHAGELVIPTPVIVETSWLVDDRLGPAAEAGFLRSVSVGELHRIDLDDADWERVIELIDGYADLNLVVVDASVIAVAERLGITTLATINHRDFRVVRPRHCDAFDLIP
ncbi:MAG TPA: PIN domain-containing protein [Acidimicrobiales bacterium]|nr:PIN domain-containing protein [Acidimicrobiales bacterium]